MPDNFKKIIDLVKTTGDNCVVLDNDGNPAYVVMPFAKYEKIIRADADVSALSEEELLNRFNADIVQWKAKQKEEEEPDSWPQPEAVESTPKNAVEPVNLAENPLNQAKKTEIPGNSENNYYFEPVD